MADDHEERFRQHEEMIQGLARMFATQHEFNQRITLAIERIDQTLAQGALTQARIETLLARMIPTGENGQDV
jgi:hypothetical protein